MTIKLTEFDFKIWRSSFFFLSLFYVCAQHFEQPFIIKQTQLMTGLERPPKVLSIKISVIADMFSPVS